MRHNRISRIVLDKLSECYGIQYTEDEKIFIENNTEVIRLKKNEYLVHSSDPREYMYFLESGVVQFCITDIDENGKKKEIVHRFIDELNIINGLSKNSNFWYHDIKALEGCTIWRMHKDKADFLFKTSLNFNHFARELYEKALRRDIVREQMMRVCDAEERYTYILKNEKWIILRCPHKSIASYIDITPQTLSVIRKRTL